MRELPTATTVQRCLLTFQQSPVRCALCGQTAVDLAHWLQTPCPAALPSQPSPADPSPGCPSLPGSDPPKAAQP